ncbi:uncharacterized protein LOC143290094 [Babylonia areolata]|uniref:uncharacterized protein LOC143290094 n=1 Tax=Babylonia areolata TaxID=304850 RepID=UPI003FD2BF9D
MWTISSVQAPLFKGTRQPELYLPGIMDTCRFLLTLVLAVLALNYVASIQVHAPEQQTAMITRRFLVICKVTLDDGERFQTAEWWRDVYTVWVKPMVHHYAVTDEGLMIEHVRYCDQAFYTVYVYYMKYGVNRPAIVKNINLTVLLEN